MNIKIITLNIYGGRCLEPLLSFFEKYKNVDVFCLQEVMHNATEKTIWNNEESPNIFSEIQRVLANHIGYFAPVESGEYGLAMFIKKDKQVVSYCDVMVHGVRNGLVDRDAKTLGRNIQRIIVEAGTGYFSLFNFHGLWNGNGKNDTPERILQSQNIVKFLKEQPFLSVLAGDFNLNPGTESLGLIEMFPLRNLINEYGIESTRTSLYSKPGKFADYIFISPELHYRNFKVLPEEVSDHAGLYIEILDI